MGKWTGWWGHLGAPVQRGIVTYELSQFEQRAFAGVLREGLPNICRRVSGQAFYIVVPFGLAYSVYYWGNENHAWRETKEGRAHYGGSSRDH